MEPEDSVKLVEIFVGILKVSDENSRIRIHVRILIQIRILSQRQGSADPDPDHKFMDPEHCC
jgi:hypothetical protein